MRIHLEAVAAQTGGSMAIEGDLDFAFADLGRGQGFLGPVHVAGIIRNRAGVLTLDYDIACTLALVCDRCLEAVKRDLKLDFSHELVLTAPENEDSDAVFCPDGILDMVALCVDDILPSLPYTTLCNPDCRGLCPVCGHNRNEGDCGHEETDSGQKDGDPRWAALKNLKLGDEN